MWSVDQHTDLFGDISDKDGLATSSTNMGGDVFHDEQSIFNAKCFGNAFE